MTHNLEVVNTPAATFGVCTEKWWRGQEKTTGKNPPPPKWPRRAGEESAAVGVAFLKKTFDVGAIPGRITGAGVFHKLLDLGIEVFFALTSLGHIIGIGAIQGLAARGVL